MTNKISNAFPPLGGATGALMEIFPNFTSISQTIILAALGAIVGYLVKILLDKMFKK